MMHGQTNIKLNSTCLVAKVCKEPEMIDENPQGFNFYVLITNLMH